MLLMMARSVPDDPATRGKKMNEKRDGGTPKIRELFIEELAEIHGGTSTDPKETIQWLKDRLTTTYGTCEEVPVC